MPVSDDGHLHENDTNESHSVGKSNCFTIGSAPKLNSLPEENILSYIAGFMCRTYLKHGCESCTKLFKQDMSVSSLNEDQEYSLFMQFKQYNHLSSTSGGLTLLKCHLGA